MPEIHLRHTNAEPPMYAPRSNASWPILGEIDVSITGQKYLIDIFFWPMRQPGNMPNPPQNDTTVQTYCAHWGRDTASSRGNTETQQT